MENEAEHRRALIHSSGSLQLRHIYSLKEEMERLIQQNLQNFLILLLHSEESSNTTVPVSNAHNIFNSTSDTMSDALSDTMSDAMSDTMSDAVSDANRNENSRRQQVFVINMVTGGGAAKSQKIASDGWVSRYTWQRQKENGIFRCDQSAIEWMGKSGEMKVGNRNFMIDAPNVSVESREGSSVVTNIAFLAKKLQRTFFGSHIIVFCSAELKKEILGSSELMDMMDDITLVQYQSDAEYKLELLQLAAEQDLIVISNDNFEQDGQQLDSSGTMMAQQMKAVINNRIFCYRILSGLGAVLVHDTYGGGRPILEAVVTRNEGDESMMAPMTT